MCKRRFLDIDILEPTCQLSLGQERSGEQPRKNTDNEASLFCLILFVGLQGRFPFFALIHHSEFYF